MEGEIKSTHPLERQSHFSFFSIFVQYIDTTFSKGSLNKDFVIKLQLTREEIESTHKKLLQDLIYKVGDSNCRTKVIEFKSGFLDSLMTLTEVDQSVLQEFEDHHHTLFKSINGEVNRRVLVYVKNVKDKGIITRGGKNVESSEASRRVQEFETCKEFL